MPARRRVCVRRIMLLVRETKENSPEGCFAAATGCPKNMCVLTFVTTNRKHYDPQTRQSANMACDQRPQAGHAGGADDGPAGGDQHGGAVQHPGGRQPVGRRSPIDVRASKLWSGQRCQRPFSLVFTSTSCSCLCAWCLGVESPSSLPPSFSSRRLVVIPVCMCATPPLKDCHILRDNKMHAVSTH